MTYWIDGSFIKQVRSEEFAKCKDGIVLYAFSWFNKQSMIKTTGNVVEIRTFVYREGKNNKAVCLGSLVSIGESFIQKHGTFGHLAIKYYEWDEIIRNAMWKWCEENSYVWMADNITKQGRRDKIRVAIRIAPESLLTHPDKEIRCLAVTKLNRD